MGTTSKALELKEIAERLVKIAANISETHDNPLPAVVPLAQLDPRWSSKPLGKNTGCTIGSDGCALTCLTMLATMLDPSITPDALHSVILPIGGMNGAYLAWGVIAQLYPRLVYDGMINWNGLVPESGLSKIHSCLDVCPTPLWVDYNPNTAVQDTHFVLGLEMVKDDIRIIDPIDGYTGMLRQRYGRRGQWDLARAIYGIRMFHLAAQEQVSFSAVQLEYDTSFPGPAPYKLDKGDLK